MWMERKERATRCTLWTLVYYKPIVTHQRTVKLWLCPAVPLISQTPLGSGHLLMRGFHVYAYVVMLSIIFIR